MGAYGVLPGFIKPVKGPGGIGGTGGRKAKDRLVVFEVIIVRGLAVTESGSPGFHQKVREKGVQYVYNPLE